MPIPKFDEFIFPVLQEIQKGSYKRTEIFLSLKNTIKEQWNLTEEEMNETVSSGGNRVKDRTDWAMTYLTKAEYIEKDPHRKMSYIITDLGKKALEDCTNNNATLGVKYLEENSPNYLSNWNVKAQKEKIYIQAKRYNIGNNVISKDIQAFLRVITKAKAKGVFITTSLFTPDAIDYAKDDEKSGNISLIDYKKLVKLCFKYKHGIRVRQTIDLFEASF